MISEKFQKISPQAICCRLYGNHIGNQSEKTKILQSLLANRRPFFASIYKEFAIKKEINSNVPLQTENMNPIEIIVHIKLENGKENIDLTELLKSHLASINKTATPPTSSVKRMASVSTPPSSHYHKKQRFFPSSKLLENKTELKKAEFGAVHSLTKFYMHLTESKSVFEKLSEEMRQSYIANPINLSTDSVVKGAKCVYVQTLGDNTMDVCRAVIVDFKPYPLSNKMSTLQVQLFLYDLGTNITVTGLNNLFVQHNDFYDLEPLSFECVLSGFDEKAPLSSSPANLQRTSNKRNNSSEELILSKFKVFTTMNPYIKIKGKYCIYLYLIMN